MGTVCFCAVQAIAMPRRTFCAEMMAEEPLRIITVADARGWRFQIIAPAQNPHVCARCAPAGATGHSHTPHTPTHPSASHVSRLSHADPPRTSGHATCAPQNTT
eukprot:2238401-Prymnesium_polylepis.2